MKGNEDRRGGGIGHAENLENLREHVDDARDSAGSARNRIIAVIGWLNTTGLTGYYQTERDQAQIDLTEARDHAHDLVQQLNRALRELGKIQ